MRSAPFLLVVLAPLAVALGACAGVETRDPPAPEPSSQELTPIPDLEIRALLLLLVDRQIYEPFTVERALGGDPEVRRELAASLARVSDRRTVPVLEVLLGDATVEVRREAAFALGQQDRERPSAALLRAVADPDAEVGRLAVASLARRGAALDEVRRALGALPPAEGRSRLLPSLFRFEVPEAVEIAAEALAADDPELERWALYSLGRSARPEGAPLLREHLDHGDPWLRGWAARGLGAVGEGGDLERLLPLLEDPHEDPVIQALRAGAGLVGQGRAGPPEAWRSHLLRLIDDPRPGVRVTALEASGAWLLDDELGSRLLERARSGPLRERELAFLALLEGEDPASRDLLPGMARDPRPELRAAAVAGAVRWEQGQLLDSLASDPDPRVRVAALQARLDRWTEGSGWPEGLEEALLDEDPIVRAVVLGWLGEHPLASYERLVLAFQGAGDDRVPDAMLAAVEALAARAEAAPRERAAVVTALEEILRFPEYRVRREAAAGLARLGSSEPSPGPATELYGVGAYKERILRSRQERTVRIDTSRGSLEILLACPTAPLTCLNFLSLAQQGFYDGVPFHRVVPGFVVQGGDPRGTGWGGPGYAIRDEVNRIRFERGVLGMASSGPDTAGSQFFVTLSPQPHLDGGYTAFGRVTSGMEVLEGILQGDRIETIREVGGPSLQPFPAGRRR